MEDITLDNLRPKFEKLISELNELNSFCIKNSINFSIYSDDNYICGIYDCKSGFQLYKLKQTKEL